MRFVYGSIKICTFAQRKRHTANTVAGTVCFLRGSNRDKNPTFLTFAARIGIHAHYFVDHTRNIQLFAQWFFAVFKQIVGYFLSDNHVFFVIDVIRLIHKTSFYNGSIFDELIIGMHAFYAVISRFVFIDNIAAPNRINRGFVFDVIAKKLGCQIVIGIVQLNGSAHAQTFVFLLSDSGPNRNTVHSIAFKLLLDSVLDSVSGA